MLIFRSSKKLRCSKYHFFRAPLRQSDRPCTVINLSADWGWKRAAKKHGSSRKLRDRPTDGKGI